jgi:eukaryotic-like serine/threonine-protein kinase
MIGQIVSHYRILEKLGEGGMGVVYKADDTRLKRNVAIKFLPPTLTGDPVAKERLIHEAQAASSLQHSSICNVHDIDETPDGQLFIVMDLYDGETLKRKIEQGPLPVSDAIDISLQVGRGLEAAHEAGMVHRDIKPANIIVTAKGEAKILDFGLAKLSGQTVLTKTGTTMGTAAYMSPEQARGETADRRTDIWSLGVTLYEMLTGKRPHESDYEQALVYSILNEDPKPLRDLRPEVPEAMERICRRALARNLKDRYETASDLIIDLESYKAGAQLSKQTRKIPSKNRRGLVYAGLAAIVLIVATLVFFYTKDRGAVFDRVAVLPFHNLSKDSTQEYLADGITEEVVARLQQIASLNVPPTRSTMQFKGSQASYAEIARELRAKALVDASILIVNNRVHVIVRLIDPSTDRPLWSGTYDGSMEDILDLQSEIAQALVRAVRVEVTRDEAERLGQSHRVDPEVYTTTLKGKVTLEHGTSEAEIQQAIGLFQIAVDRDPSYAPAWAGLGQALWMLAATGFEYIAPGEVRDKAVAAAERALELDGNLPDAHMARAVIAWDGEWDLGKAEKEFRRALELQPGYAAAHNAFGQMLSGEPLPRFDEGRRHLEQARELDPLSPWNDINSVAWWLFQGRLDTALVEGERVRRRDPTNYVISWQMGFAQLGLGRPGQAASEFEAALKLLQPDRPASVLAPLGLAYGLAGRRTEALMILGEMDSASEKRYISPYYRAAVYSGLGRMDEAFRLLNKALDQRTPWLVFCTPCEPLSVALRHDPRWKPFIDRLRHLVRLPAGTPDLYS